MEYIANMVPVGMNGQTDYDENDSTKVIEKYIFAKVEWFENEPSLKAIPKSAQHGILAGIFVSLIIGSYFKYVYYGCILKRGLLTKESLCNLMLISGSILQHIKQVLGAAFYVLVLGFDVEIGQLFGAFSCKLIAVLNAFVFSHLVIGTLMTAIFRVMYIKCNQWVKYKAGMVTVFLALFLGGFVISAAVTFLIQAEADSKRVLINACMGHSEAFVDIMYQYRNPMGKYNLIYTSKRCMVTTL